MSRTKNYSWDLMDITDVADITQINPTLEAIDDRVRLVSNTADNANTVAVNSLSAANKAQNTAANRAKRAVSFNSELNTNTNRQMVKFFIADLNNPDLYADYSFMFVRFGFLANFVGSNNGMVIPLNWFRNAQIGFRFQGCYDLNGIPESASFEVFRDNTFLVLQLNFWSSPAPVDIRDCHLF